MATSFTVDKDVEEFGKLMGALFESGYRKAVKDLQGQIEDLGYKVDIKSED